MSESSYTVFWNNEKIGVITNSKVDNFEFYGDWEVIADTELYEAFLKEVDQREYGASVEFGNDKSKLSGNILVEPDEEVDIKMYPNNN